MRATPTCEPTTSGPGSAHRPAPGPATATATATDWRRAGTALVAKALAEFAYEELVTPTPDGPGRWRLDLPTISYRFTGGRGPFDDWQIDPGSVGRGSAPADDPVQFLLDVRTTLGLDGPTTAEVMRELLATQTADARIRATGPSAAALADLGYAELEQHLDGHPVLLLNKGRLGFTGADLDRYAPEAHGTVALRWYAAHRRVASFAAVPGLDSERLLAEELEPATRAEFTAALVGRGLDPAQYLWLPVHPYQEAVTLRPLFAAHLAEDLLVPLGEGPERYRPVQSVRTLVAAGRRDVKVPLLMRNTLVWRGLGGPATAAAPAISAWLDGLGADQADPPPGRLRLLTEVASVVVRHDALDAVPRAPYRYRELLGALWRTPVESHLRAGERARSLAALLHVDNAGRALLSELVTRSGLAPTAWLDRLLDAVLPGLLEYLTRHGIAFCPHGENTVVVYDEADVPVRVLVKDLAEDVTLRTGGAYPGLDPDTDAVLVRWPAQEQAHSILSAVLAGHFRFLAPLAARHLGLPEAQFWAQVRSAVLRFRAANPELVDVFDALGLLAPRFERVALNREHLTGGGFHDRAERDEAPDVVHGTVPNPLVLAEGRGPC